MKRIYLTLCLFSCSFLCTYAQLKSVNVKIIDDKQRLHFNDPSSNKRSVQVPKQCDVDTVQYPLYKSSSLLVVTVSKGRSLGQMYSCPKPLVLSGFTFYAFVVPSNPPTYRSMNMICNVYKAGADSLPRGLPLRSDTIFVDTTFGNGKISFMMKRAEFAPITLDSNYVLTVETDSGTLSAGIVTNNYQNGDGRRENLNCGSISGLWYKGRNLNVGGIPFNCDILLHPYVKYKFGTDFTIKSNCYNINDSVKFINGAAANMAGSRMYNLYMTLQNGMYSYFSHLWDAGNNMGNTYSIDHKIQYSSKQNYQIRLISTVYHYNGPNYGCVDTTIKTLYFKPDIPTFSGLTNLCIGDSAKFTAVSADTGVIFEWMKKPVGVAPFFTGNVFKKFPLTRDDTFYLRANNNGCLSGVRTIIMRVNTYPASLVVKDDSICAGSKANLKATANIGAIQWYTTLTGGVPFYIGNVYQTKVLNSDTMFYAQAVNIGCALNPRKAVKAFVGSNFAPGPPAVSSDTTVCLGVSVITLNATAAAGLTIRWFDVSSGGSSINTGNTFNFLPTKREVKVYYVDAYNGVCGSTRVPISVTIEDYPVISKLTNDTLCKGDSAYLGFTLPFGDANWFDASTGGNNVFTGTNYVSAPSGNVSYYIETSSSVCVSPTRTKISAVVNTFPAISKLWGDTICAKNKATLKSVLLGNGNLNWYDSDTSGTILGTGKTFQTPVINSGLKYYAQPFYAGCIGPRQVVQPTVKPVPFSGFSFEVMTWQQVRVYPINRSGSSVKWYFGDGGMSNSDTVKHRYQNPGTYQIKLVLTHNANGCKDSTTISVLIEVSSINALAKLSDARVYPNPALTDLNIHSVMLGNESRQVSIYSSTGALVRQVGAEAIDGLLTIPVSGISPGFYIIHINGFTPLMFVKE